METSRKKLQNCKALGECWPPCCISVGQSNSVFYNSSLLSLKNTNPKHKTCFFIETYNDSIIFDSCTCCKVEWGILQNTWKLVFVKVGERTGVFNLCLFSFKSLYKDTSCFLSFQVLCCGKLMMSSPKLLSKMLLTSCKLQLYLELGFLVTCMCSACLLISNRWWSLNLKYELVKKQSKDLVFHVNFAKC